MKVMICLAMFVAVAEMYLIGPALNTPGDGQLPAQSITATALGYKRTFPCESQPLMEDYLTCDRRFAQVQAFAPWAIPQTESVAVYFGRLNELGALALVSLVVFYLPQKKSSA